MRGRASQEKNADRLGGVKQGGELGNIASPPSFISRTAIGYNPIKLVNCINSASCWNLGGSFA